MHSFNTMETAEDLSILRTDIIFLYMDSNQHLINEYLVFLFLTKTEVFPSKSNWYLKVQ